MVAIAEIISNPQSHRCLPHYSVRNYRADVITRCAALPRYSNFIQSNRYDGAGNALVMVTTAGTATNSYDPANRLTGSISPLGTTILTYDGRNRRTGIQTPDGGITTYTWTDDHQLAAITLPNGGGGIVTNT